jgi:hypothetical protein
MIHYTKSGEKTQALSEFIFKFISEDTTGNLFSGLRDDSVNLFRGHRFVYDTTCAF